MERTVILNDGNAMPRLGYGVWQLGNDEAERLVATSIATGYRHIDTAQAYFNEAGVGRAVNAADIPRAELFVTSKLRGRDMGRDTALRSFDQTLARMDLSYLDLFLIHWPMPKLDLFVDTWRALIELRASGRVRSIGVSNFTPAHIARVVGDTGVTPAVNQVEIHPYFQQRGIRDYHRNQGIVIQSYSPLGGGGSGVLRNDAIAEIAKSHGRTPAQTVIRWHLQKGLARLCPRRRRSADSPRTSPSGTLNLTLRKWSDWARWTAGMAIPSRRRIP